MQHLLRLSSPIQRHQDLLKWISTKIIGIITGKLRIDIKVPLLPAFDAMADIMVNTVEKLILPSNTAIK